MGAAAAGASAAAGAAAVPPMAPRMGAFALRRSGLTSHKPPADFNKEKYMFTNIENLKKNDYNISNAFQH